jgi:hypothetical protein
LIIDVADKKYELRPDPEDPYVVPGLLVFYCHQLAEDFMPVIFDPKGYGSKPYPPDLFAYRLIVDPKMQKLCVLYEVYWRRQECTWKELNKNHDHDYEQIQIHFNLTIGEAEKIIVSSVGPIENAGHGVEVYSYIPRAGVKSVIYTTSMKNHFPWGGKSGQNNSTQIREIPIERLIFKKKRPVVLVVNCYHAFVGLKRRASPIDGKNMLKPNLYELDRKLLDLWYYRNAKNRFGHDISNPFKEPYIKYSPPPEDIISRLVYTILWLFATIRNFIC